MSLTRNHLITIKLAGTSVLAAFLLCGAFVPPSCPQDSSRAGAQLRGTVTECWEGEPRAVPNLRIYVLSLQESSKVRSILERIRKTPPGHTTEGVQQFSKFFDELVASLKSLGRPAGLTRTDTTGRFTMGELKPGENYLVLAIDWERGDSDEVAYYRHFMTESLKAGVTKVSIYLGPGNKRDCASK